MPKIRSLKAEFWRDPALRRLTERQRALFAVLITACADDEGRLQDDPERIRDEGWNQTLPAENLNRDIAVLAELGNIIRYRADDGGYYIAIATWFDHQRVPHPVPSKIPAPPDELLAKARGLRRAQRIQPIIHEASGGLMSPHEDSCGLMLEGKGGGGEVERTPLPSESFQDSSVKGDVSSRENVASQPFEARQPEEFASLWRRTQNAIRKYEALVPDGKPVTVEEALAYQEAISKAVERGGAHLRAIEHYASQGPEIYRRFAKEGIMYAGKPLGQGQFGKRTGRPRQKRRKEPDKPFDGRRGE